MSIVGVDIGGTAIKLGLVGESGEIHHFRDYPTESEKGGPYVLQKLIEEISKFESFTAIGISTLGQIDRKRGMYAEEAANIPRTKNLQIRQPLEDYFQVPVAIENDVNAAALGEQRFGKGKALNNFLYVAYGTGIGGAIVDQSSLYVGQDGFAGEFGHMVTHAFGKKCGCGQLGCYEQYASTSALVASAKKLDETFINGRIIFDKYHAGEDAVINLVHQWINEIVVGLASLIHIFNPQAIVLGGGVMEQTAIVERIKTLMSESIFQCFRGVELQMATLGNQASLLGAASLHMSKLIR